MTEEPYRWLEAIGHRREYVREQLRGSSPVAVVSRPEGIYLAGIGPGRSKVFEVYDRQALAALGHPVDIERLRQTAIESAHLEGFNRSPADVTLRRLIAFALSPMLKQTFEQLFAPPILAEGIFAELGARPDEDLLTRIGFDGRFRDARRGALVAHTEPLSEAEAEAWLNGRLEQCSSPGEVLRTTLGLLRQLGEEARFSVPEEGAVPLAMLPAGRQAEIGFLARGEGPGARFQLLPAASVLT